MGVIIYNLMGPKFREIGEQNNYTVKINNTKQLGWGVWGASKRES